MEFVKEFKKHPITFVLVGINVVVFLVNGILQDALKSYGPIGEGVLADCNGLLSPRKLHAFI